MGAGGSGEVYKATHIHLKTNWALKMISSQEECASNEIAVLQNLNHPAFPRLVDVITEEGKYILVFDYYNGPTLANLLEEYGRFQEDRVIGWAMQILDAISYLHHQESEPIIYRDLKPSNLIVLPDNRLKLIDFGTARLYKNHHHDDTVYLGTPVMRHLKQFGLARPTSGQNIYNFGMTLFHLLTGKHPLLCKENQMESIRKMKGFPTISGIVLKCTAKNPLIGCNARDESRMPSEAFGSRRNKPESKVHGRNAVEISVSGIQSGVGVTHFCFLFGIWLKNQGFRTAVLDASENRDTLALCKLVEKENQMNKNGCFQIQGLSIFPAMGKEKIDGFKRTEYDYILLDMAFIRVYIAICSAANVRLILATGGGLGNGIG